MKQFLLFSLFLVSAVALAENSTATVQGMSCDSSDSISANGTVPTMGWDTTTTTAISASVLNQKLESGRCFNLDGVALSDCLHGIIIENNHKILIKR